MTAEYSGDFFWTLAFLLGWLAVFMLAMAHHARRRFRQLLKAPLTEEVEHLTHLWEGRLKLWMTFGFLLSAVSLSCFAAWLML